MLVVSPGAMKDIRRMGEEAYPNEGCGFLLGTRDGDGTKRVHMVRRAENANTDRSRDRFEIDPKEFFRTDRLAQRDGREILGFFHSHPDHPDRPSEFDREMAWPQYSYIIQSVVGGKHTSARSWVLDEKNREFYEEELETEEERREDARWRK